MTTPFSTVSSATVISKGGEVFCVPGIQRKGTINYNCQKYHVETNHSAP
jgi:hypothetical protein